MRKYKEKLEVRYRLIRIKKFKIAIYALQSILLIILSAFFVYHSGSFVPFFLPLDSIVLLVLVILFVLCVESIFFRAMEIFYAEEDSTKHLMASNSIKKSIGIIIVCVIIFALLFTPRFVGFIENKISIEKNNLLVNATGTSRDFSSQDALGLTKVSDVVVEVETGEVTVTILQKNGILIRDRLTQGESKSFNIGGSIDGYEELSLIINNTAGSGGSEVNYTIKSSLSFVFVTITPMLAVFFIVVNLVWLAFLYPFKERYAPYSIYSRRYVALKDVGVEVWSERGSLVIKKGDKVIPLYREEEVHRPKIKPEVPIKPAEKKREEKKVLPPKKEIKRKSVRKVEKKAEKEKEGKKAKVTGDVICSSCGTPNSPYAFLCYSCGSKLREIKSKEVEDEEKAYVVLMKTLNVGPAKARALYNAGFRSVEAIKNASIDELSKIKGISKKLAKEIVGYLANH